MLVTFEGIDGSGKSTQARLLVERLQSTGYEPLFVREPGGTNLSERIRSILLDPDISIVPFSELLLFSAARAQLVAEKIRPALESGTIVVCDRFYDSTTAYQGGGRQLEDLSWLRTFNERVTGGLVPDRTFFIYLNPGDAVKRRTSRDSDSSSEGDDRMEAAGLAFYERVTGTYHSLAAAEPHRFITLDGAASIDSLHTRIWEEVSRLLALRRGTR